jgi:phosphatidylinositol alpha 1,6-mannosyltransferase
LDPETFERELPAAVAKLTFPGEPERAEAMRDVCRDTVRQRTWSALCDQLMDHYAAVSGTHPGSLRGRAVA